MASAHLSHGLLHQHQHMWPQHKQHQHKAHLQDKQQVWDQILQHQHKQQCQSCSCHQLMPPALQEVQSQARQQWGTSLQKTLLEGMQEYFSAKQHLLAYSRPDPYTKAAAAGHGRSRRNVYLALATQRACLRISSR